MRAFFKNEYIFSVIIKILMTGIGIIHSIVLVRFLGTEYKGVLSTIQSYAGILAVVMEFGIHEVYPFYRNKYNDSDKLKSEYVTSILMLYLFYFAIIFLTNMILDLSIIAEYCALYTPILAYSVIIGYIYLIENPKGRNLYLLVISILEVFLLMILLIAKIRINYCLLFIILIFADLLKSIYFTFKLKCKFIFKEIRVNFICKIYKKGFFTMIALLLTSLNYKVDIIMLNGFENVSMSQIGIYSVGVSIAEKVAYIPDSIREILLARLAKGKSNYEIAQVVRMSVVVGLITAIAIMLIGKPLITILYGSDYTGAFLTTLICLLGTTAMIFFKLLSQYNVVKNKQIVNAVMLGISVIINILFNLLLIPTYGITGAAVASLLGHIACSVAFIIYFSKETQIPIKDIVLIKKDDFRLIMKK